MKTTTKTITEKFDKDGKLIEKITVEKSEETNNTYTPLQDWSKTYPYAPTPNHAHTHYYDNSTTTVKIDDNIKNPPFFTNGRD